MVANQEISDTDKPIPMNSDGRRSDLASVKFRVVL